MNKSEIYSSTTETVLYGQDGFNDFNMSRKLIKCQISGSYLPSSLEMLGYLVNSFFFVLFG